MSKLVALSNEAYERLQARKNGSDSFSDVVLRVTGSGKLSDFAGLLTETEADEMEEKIRNQRALSKKRAERIRKELSV